MKSFQDIDKVCIEENCKAPFVWTAGEQSFMQQLHDEGKIKEINPPKRCSDCRAAKKKKFEKFERPAHTY